MKNYRMPIIGGVLGIACGLVSHTSFLEGKWANLIVWGLAGIVFGLFLRDTRQIVWAGIAFGFLLSVTFLIAGFQGSANNLPAFLLLTLVLSVFGIGGGLAAVFIGSRVRRLFR
jgi:hypothetical protein